MTEGREEETVAGGSWFENTYNQWLRFYGKDGNGAKKFAIEQTLHKTSLMEIKDWDVNSTPAQIADNILKIVPEEVKWWIHRRNEFPTRQLEQDKHDPAFRRVFSVKSELISRMRRVEKEK
jgi:hypothetical protein